MRLEPLESPSRYRVLGVTLAALGVAFVLVGGLFAAYGLHPLEAYRAMLSGTLLDAKGWQEILRRSIPLLLIGVGLTLAFRTQFFNIGAEGQLLLGAVFAAGVALFVPLPPWLSLLGMGLAGALGGAWWCLLAAWLKTRLSVNEILTTLMLNYVAQSLVIFLINGPWKGKDARGYIYSDRFAEYQQIAVLPGTNVHWPTLLLGVVLALVLQLMLVRTPIGFQMRVVGENPGAARYLGIPGGRVILWVALITGGLAGLAGVGEIAGIHHRLIEPGQLSSGYGFTAIIVAWLARGNPALVLLTAPLMGLILAGGDLLKVSLNMPFRIVDVFSGVMLMCLIASEVFLRNRVRWGR
ncbi:MULTISPECIES: ABC transporter permease [Meiothermus]|uniref:ABC transporter permease n=2 Tax=Meiothermus hypogaeus TaxID=884155 RepID=A0A511R1Z5_9DEIN|nr:MULTISPECIES: ABC transporter permease [Meiothermus]RIH74209.1 Branched-chain amino acid transport system / permease component [Meiothermus hypogaeus]GEM82872.1 ABC transporter permease [Meiothermus hypogaeus NBRC 106114]GIW35829.1 MAG: ABC transporter permease [Meiothermus sp.]